jgi:hypothetical protein
MAPSLIGEELPAVTVPSRLKEGASPRKVSTVLSGRMDSSRCTPSTSNAKPSWTPDCQAAAADWCERAAQAS